MTDMMKTYEYAKECGMNPQIKDNKVIYKTNGHMVIHLFKDGKFIDTTII